MPVYKRKEESLRYNKNLRDEWDKKNKPVIITTDDTDTTSEWICKWCNYTIKGKFTADSIYCSHCQLEIFLDNDTRKSLKSVKAHNTMDDGEIFVNYPQNPNDMVPGTKYHKPSEPKGSFAELQKRGVKITKYEERGGDGQII